MVLYLDSTHQRCFSGFISNFLCTFRENQSLLHIAVKIIYLEKALVLVVSSEKGKHLLSSLKYDESSSEPNTQIFPYSRF